MPTIPKELKKVFEEILQTQKLTAEANERAEKIEEQNNRLLADILDDLVPDSKNIQAEQMIDFTNEIYFYDDRHKQDHMYQLEKVLYIDDMICLCEVNKRHRLDLIDMNLDNEKFLVDVDHGNVMNSEFDSWIATNDIDWALKELEREYGS